MTSDSPLETGPAAIDRIAKMRTSSGVALRFMTVKELTELQVLVLIYIETSCQAGAAGDRQSRRAQTVRQTEVGSRKSSSQPCGAYIDEWCKRSQICNGINASPTSTLW